MQKPSLRVDDLPIGVPLPFNIVGQHGEVLYRAGYSLTATDVSRILERGLVSDQTFKPSLPINSATRPYDHRVVERVEQAISQASELIYDVVSQIEAKVAFELSQLESVVAELLDSIVADSDATLATSSNQKNDESEPADKHLLQRSIQMSVLSSAIATQQKLSREECHTIGMAAMLHDLSLFSKCAKRFHDRLGQTDPFQHYLLHPHFSVELVSQCKEVTPLTRIVMSQAHEQVDGSGFPKGLRGHQLNQLSRILNLVDAYFCMLEPHPLRDAIVPADAIAYLIYHTTQGRFDRECVMAFLQVESIYPIGSSVELSDSQPATVLRSVGQAPLNPVVRLEDGSQRVVDLSHEGKFIRGPIVQATANRQRLKRSAFDDILWMPPTFHQGIIG